MRKILFVAALMSPTLAISQLSVDFSGNELPASCEGAYEAFELADGRLNSSNTVAGESYLFSPSQAIDGAEWKLSVEMPEPNGSCFARYYLAFDSPSPEKGGSGYFLRIGDTHRMITLCYQKPSGTVSTLAKSDSMRLVAPEGAKSLHVDLKVKRTAKGVWKVYSKLDGERAFKEDCAVTDLTATYSFYSGLYCKYPKAKAGDFHFDDWVVTGDAAPDDLPPSLLGYSYTDSTFTCQFSELLNIGEMSFNAPSLFDGDPIFEAKSRSLIFPLSGLLVEGVRYELNLFNCKDFAGNSMDTTILFGLPVPAEKGDVLFTEIMFAPATGMSEFVEVVNHSNKVLDLSDFTFATRKADAAPLVGKRLTTKQSLLFPGEYKVLTKKMEGVCGSIPCPGEESFLITSSLAAMNNSGGWISLYRFSDSTLVEEVFYSPDFHVDGVPNKGTGVSLERLSLEEDKWTSASPATGYASPGRENQTMMANEDVLLDAEKICYPYLDESGSWHLYYTMDQAGYQASAKVYTLTGILVATIADEAPLSVVGELSWNGCADSGQALPVAPYVVVMEAIHPAGIHFRRHFVVLVSR